MPSLRYKRKVLSGPEGLLEITGLEVMAEGVRAGKCSESWSGGREFQTVAAATLKLPAAE